MVLKVHTFLARWLSWLERRPVTAEVVGSNPIRVVYPQGYILISEYGILAQLGEHLPYKQGVTGSSPVGPIYTSYSINDKKKYADVAQFSRNKDCVHDGNIRRTNACIDVRLMFSLHRRLHRERENEVFERHAIVKIHTPMWLNWQSS